MTGTPLTRLRAALDYADRTGWPDTNVKANDLAWALARINTRREAMSQTTTDRTLAAQALLDAADEILEQANAHTELADKYGGYHAGARSAMQADVERLRARAASLAGDARIGNDDE